MTILSGELKMSAKHPKNGPFHCQVFRTKRASVQWFSEQRNQIFYLKCEMRRVLPSLLQSSFNVLEAKNLIGGQK